MNRTGNPWEAPGLRSTGPKTEGAEPAGDDATPVLWHGRPVTTTPLEWSGSTSGDFKPIGLTPAQFDCLMSLRYGRDVAVVPPGGGHAVPGMADAIGYLAVTVRSLLANGFIRARAGGLFSITDNGLHALRVCRVIEKTGKPRKQLPRLNVSAR
jgi:hypothetical protein